jgi:iron-sulfur cluster assembly protein
VADEGAKELQMLTVTKEAAELLKAAKAADNAPDYAGIRILAQSWVVSYGTSGVVIGFAVSQDPSPDDEEFEQEGLRIFIEDALIEPLNGRILDVREASQGPELIFR